MLLWCILVVSLGGGGGGGGPPHTHTHTPLITNASIPNAGTQDMSFIYIYNALVILTTIFFKNIHLHKNNKMINIELFMRIHYSGTLKESCEEH